MSGRRWDLARALPWNGGVVSEVLHGFFCAVAGAGVGLTLGGAWLCMAIRRNDDGMLTAAEMIAPALTVFGAGIGGLLGLVWGG